MTWTKYCDGPFFPRDSAKSFEFNGYHWLSGGWRGTGQPVARDLWRTRDGLIWGRVLASTPYDAYAGTAVLNGEIYAIRETTWRSSDGETWTQIASATPIGSQSICSLHELDGRLYLLGAESMHSTCDGVAWRDEPLPAVLKRGSHAACVFNGRLILAGGATMVANSPAESGYPGRTSYNDVWAFDGSAWVRLTASAGWSRRMWPGLCAHKDRLFIVGGYSNIDNANIADCWASLDGETWTRYQGSQLFSARHFPTLYSTQNGLVMVAGNPWHPITTVVADVWMFGWP